MAGVCTPRRRRDGAEGAACQRTAMTPVSPDTRPPALSTTGNGSLCVGPADVLVPIWRSLPHEPLLIGGGRGVGGCER